MKLENLENVNFIANVIKCCDLNISSITKIIDEFKHVQHEIHHTHFELNNNLNKTIIDLKSLDPQLIKKILTLVKSEEVKRKATSIKKLEKL